MSFANYVKLKTPHVDLMPFNQEAGMMCTFIGQSFCFFTKHTWIGDLGASCHITNNDTGMYDVTHIDRLVQGGLGSISATKNGKL